MQLNWAHQRHLTSLQTMYTEKFYSLLTLLSITYRKIICSVWKMQEMVFSKAILLLFLLYLLYVTILLKELAVYVQYMT